MVNCKKLRYKRSDDIDFNVVFGIIVKETEDELILLTGNGKPHKVLKKYDTYTLDDTTKEFILKSDQKINEVHDQ